MTTTKVTETIAAMRLAAIVIRVPETEVSPEISNRLSAISRTIL